MNGRDAGADGSAAIERTADRLGGLVRRDVPIGPYTTYRVGGAADLFAEVGSFDDLRTIAGVAAETGVATLVVGNGSNMLVADRGFRGLAVRLGERFSQVVIDGDRVRAGGAALLPQVARLTVGAGLTGFEWAVGVPGSIGGAVRMNAGGHGSDMAASLSSIQRVDFATGEDAVVPADDLALGYRSSNIGPSQVVVEAELHLAPGDRAAGDDALREIVRWRRANQPGGHNAGSVFTNPPGDSAGRLIDVSGGKGLRHGSAEVSTKHANFIQADDGGRADDVFALMCEVAALVRQRAGVSLHAETRLVGFLDHELADLQEGRP